MSANVSNKLKQNRDAGAIFSLLNNAKISENIAIAWKFENGSKITAEMKFRVIRKFRNEVEFVPLHNNKSKLDRIVSGNDLVNIFLPDQAIIFQTKVKGYGQNQTYSNGSVLRISLPEMIAQIDRRKDLRLPVLEGMNAKVIFSKELMLQRVQAQSFNKSCFDISAGGCSFIITQTEKKFFNVEDVINEIVVNVGNAYYKLSGKVVNIIKIDPENYKNIMYGGYKICIKFSNVSKEVANGIRLYVFQNIELEETAI